MNSGKIWLVAAALTFTFMLVMNALAEDCPAGAKSCKVVTMTDQEIQSLEGPGAVFDSAAWANRANLQAVVDAWKQKIAASPAGVVKTPEPEKKPEIKK
jgi:O-glycosyl hydrolase